MPQLYKIPLVLSPQPEGGVYGNQPGITGAHHGGRYARRGHPERERRLGGGAGTVRRSSRPLPANARQDPQADPI